MKRLCEVCHKLRAYARGCAYGWLWCGGCKELCVDCHRAAYARHGR